MNRDELRTRKEAPELYNNSQNHKEITICYPVDLLSGGSWIGVNEKGVALALLNRYHEKHIDMAKSRGSIIPYLLKQGDVAAIINAIHGMKMQSFNPFELLIFSKGQIYNFCWNGTDLSLQTHQNIKNFFETSSSVDTETVIKERKNLFDNFCKEHQQEEIRKDDILYRFHCQQKLCKSHSIFMSRKHSHTKSVLQIIMDLKRTTLTYYAQNTLVSWMSEKGKKLHYNEAIELQLNQETH